MNKLIIFMCLMLGMIIGIYEYKYSYNLVEYNTGGQERKVYISSDFNAIEVNGIKEAIKEWNKALNGVIKYRIADEHFNREVWKIKAAYIEDGLMIVKEEDDGEVDETGHGVIAFVEAIGGNVIYAVGDRMRGNEKEVIMHEMGHILGAEHQSGTLMNWEYDRKIKCIDRETMKQVALYNGLNINQVRYCI